MKPSDQEQASANLAAGKKSDGQPAGAHNCNTTAQPVDQKKNALSKKKVEEERKKEE